MRDPSSIMISCSTLSEFVGTRNAVNMELPPEMRKPFAKIFTNYIARFGIEGAFERMNHRTVAQIFAEFEPGEPKVVASGELDGLRYTLYEAPNPPPDDDSKSIE